MQLTDLSKVLLHKDVNGNIQWIHIILALAVSIFIMVIVVAFLWQTINTNIKQTARCSGRSSRKNRDKDIHVYAKDQYDNPMYKVTYNLAKKSKKLDCACAPGSVHNTFKNVKVYDIRSHKNIDKDISCQCDEHFDSIDAINTYYYGEPDLVRYMVTDDKDVFNEAYRE